MTILPPEVIPPANDLYTSFPRVLHSLSPSLSPPIGNQRASHGAPLRARGWLRSRVSRGEPRVHEIEHDRKKSKILQKLYLVPVLSAFYSYQPQAILSSRCLDILMDATLALSTQVGGGQQGALTELFVSFFY